MYQDAKKTENRIVRNSFKTSTALWFGGISFDEKRGNDVGNNGDENAKTDYWSDVERQEKE